MFTFVFCSHVKITPCVLIRGQESCSHLDRSCGQHEDVSIICYETMAGGKGSEGADWPGRVCLCLFPVRSCAESYSQVSIRVS